MRWFLSVAALYFLLFAASAQAATYDSAQEFASTWGGTTGVWRYQSLQNTYSDLSPCSFAEYGWCGGAPYPAIFRDAGNGYPLVAHPGHFGGSPDGAVALGWVAPQGDPQVALHAEFRFAYTGGTGGDGVGISLKKNEQVLASAVLPAGDFAQHTLDAGAVSVAANDILRLVIDARGDNFYDGTAVNFVVTTSGNPYQAVRVSGVVESDCGGPLAGVTVDLAEPNGQFHTTFTNEAGAYTFSDIPSSDAPDAAVVSLVIPLGHEAVTPGVTGQALTLNIDQTVNFELACLAPVGPPRSIGYWKHSANVYLTQRGSAQESRVDMAVNFPGAIFQHFHDNALRAIAVENVTHRGVPPQPIDLQTMASTLAGSSPGTAKSRASQHYLALLLNIASGKLSTMSVVTVDGGTASQVLQYAADLINDTSPSNDQLAADMCATINNARLLAAGQLPAGQYDTIAYSRPLAVAQPLTVTPNPGRVEAQSFAFRVPTAGMVNLEIFDVGGRRVAVLVHEFLGAGVQQFSWSGRNEDGTPVADGLYFGRLVTASGAETTRFLRLTR